MIQNVSTNEQTSAIGPKYPFQENKKYIEISLLIPMIYIQARTEYHYFFYKFKMNFSKEKMGITVALTDNIFVH